MIIFSPSQFDYQLFRTLLARYARSLNINVFIIAIIIIIIIKYLTFLTSESQSCVFAISKIPVAYLSQRYLGTHAMRLRFIILQTTSLMHFICNFCIRSPLIRMQRVHKRMHRSK